MEEYRLIADSCWNENEYITILRWLGEINLIKRISWFNKANGMLWGGESIEYGLSWGDTWKIVMKKNKWYEKYFNLINTFFF